MSHAVPLLTVAALLVVVVWFDLYCLRDLNQADRVYVLPRQSWALLCVFVFPVGGMLYLTYGRGPRR